MADFLQKYNLVNNQDQQIDADASIIAFDFTNDSPFDVDIKWGQNKPVAATIPPTTIWRGLKPSADLLISGNKRNGTIIATPSYPGGGSPPSGAPAMQLTVHGYVKGNEPFESLATLNRLQNVGNPIAVGNNATNLINDNNPSGTEVIEASIGGVKHLSVLNDGLTKLLRDTTSANQDVLEFVDIKVGGKDYQFLLLSTGGIRLLNVTDGVVIMDWLPTGALNISGTAIQTSAAGNVFCTGVKLTNLAGGVFTGQTGMGLQAFSKFTGTTTGTYSHGLGIAPTHVDPEQHAVGSSSFGWDSETSTQVHITNFNGAAFSAMAYNI